MLGITLGSRNHVGEQRSNWNAMLDSLKFIILFLIYSYNLFLLSYWWSLTRLYVLSETTQINQLCSRNSPALSALHLPDSLFCLKTCLTESYALRAKTPLGNNNTHLVSQNPLPLHTEHSKNDSMSSRDF